MLFIKILYIVTSTTQVDPMIPETMYSCTQALCKQARAHKVPLFYDYEFVYYMHINYGYDKGSTLPIFTCFLRYSPMFSCNFVIMHSHVDNTM